LAVAVTKNIEFGGTYTYDDAFESRASADLTIRFGGGSNQDKSKQQAKAEAKPQIKGLSEIPRNRDVRVHDRCIDTDFLWQYFVPVLALGQDIALLGCVFGGGK